MSIGQGSGAIIGAVLGSIFMPGVGTVWGGFMGASIGMSLGGIAENLISPNKIATKDIGPADLLLPTSQEGLPIPIVYGKRIITGNCIWYGNFQAIRNEQQQQGGKGIGGGGRGATYYTYSVSLAFGIAINPCHLIRIYADGSLLNTTYYTWNFHDGSQNNPDPHIESILTSQYAPTWKGLTYIVFPNFNLGTDTSVPIFKFVVSNKASTYVSNTSDNYETTNGVVPDEIIKDVLCNDWYGLGLSPGLIDDDSFGFVHTRAVADEAELCVIVDTQVSVLDFISYILNHHNGMLVYRGGLFCYIQLWEGMTASTTITQDDYIKSDKGYLTLEIKSDADIYNSITLQFRNWWLGTIRTTVASDIIDIDTNGLKDTQIKLEGIVSKEYAKKIAQRALNKSISNPRIIKTTLGLKNLESILVGDQVTFVDDVIGFSALATITAVSLTEDYLLKVEAVEEIVENYDATGAGVDDYIPPGIRPIFLPASSVTDVRINYTSLYTNIGNGSAYYINYRAPDEVQWAASSLYKSYKLSSGYTLVDKTANKGVVGSIVEIGTINNEAYITVNLNSGDTLSSALDFDDLLTTPKLNLCEFVRTDGSNVFVRYGTAELISGTQWRLSDFIYDITGFSLINTSGDLTTSATFYLYPEIMPYRKDVSKQEIGKTLYFKVVSSNFKAEEQDLGDVTAVSLLCKDAAFIPLIPVNLKINDIGVTSTNVINIGAGEFTFSWVTRNRSFTGMLDFENTDTSDDDVEYIKCFIKITITNPSPIVREEESTIKSFFYSSAMQIADGNPTSFTVSIRQKNNNYYSDWSSPVTINIL